MRGRIPHCAALASLQVRVCKHLHHPNVIRCHEVLVSKAKIFMVFDLAEGGDLHDLITSYPSFRVPPEQAWSYFKQLLDALEYCHSMGVCHRDIKPGATLQPAATTPAQHAASPFGRVCVARRERATLRGQVDGDAGGLWPRRHPSLVAAGAACCCKGRRRRRSDDVS